MKLIFTKYLEADVNFFLPWSTADLIKRYLWFHQLHCEILSVDYNYVYHFYDIHIRAYNEEDTIPTLKEAVSIFEQDGHKVEIADMNGWDWIYKDEYRSRKLPPRSTCGDRCTRTIGRIWVYPKAR